MKNLLKSNWQILLFSIISLTIFVVFPKTSQGETCWECKVQYVDVLCQQGNEYSNCSYVISQGTVNSSYKAATGELACSGCFNGAGKGGNVDSTTVWCAGGGQANYANIGVWGACGQEPQPNDVIQCTARQFTCPVSFVKIGGRVTNSSGTGISGVNISVYDNNLGQTKTGSSPTSLTTDFNGYFWVDSFVRVGDDYAVRPPSSAPSGYSTPSNPANWEAQRAGGSQDCGPNCSFQYTACPNVSAPTGLSPSSNVAQGTTSVNLTWNNVSGATYNVEFKNDTDNVTTNYNNLTTNSRNSVTVAAGKSYTWKVTAVKAGTGGCSTTSATSSPASFSVPTDLQTPTVSCRVNGGTSPITVTTGTDVTWSTTITPTGSYTHSWSGTALNSSNPGNVSSFTKNYSTSGSRTARVTVSRSGFNTTTVDCPTVTVNEPFNYSFNPPPNNITVTQGSSGSTTITLTKDAGTAQSVSLSSGSPIPAGASKGSSPNPGSCSPNNTCNSTFTISTSSPTSTTPTPVGTYPITITGSTAGLSNKTTSFNLIVQAATGGPIPTVNIRANNSEGPISIAHSAAATLSWTTTNCTLANNCTCTASGAWCPAGNCPKSISGSTEGTGSKTGPNSYSYTLTCSNANDSNSDTVTVNVTAAPGASPTPTPPPGATPTPTPTPPPPSSTCPWIQTTGGSVHSNTGIDSCST